MVFAFDLRQDFKQNGLNPKLKEKFQSIIWEYYRKHTRSLPWRYTKDPYHIFVSEFMLQQTQAQRVVPKYKMFLKKFPSFQDLSNADFNEILGLWQGLGYNRRARWLHDAAKLIVEKYEGELPDNVGQLEEIKGIGHATASEMISFAYNKPTAFIETNIRRVVIYFFFHNQTEIKDSDIMEIVEYMIDTQNPREWYYAFMDYGVFLKKKYPKRNPNKRSAHYRKQSNFEGSNRQIRGIILKILLKSPGKEFEQLLTAVNIKKKRLQQILEDLIKERFIKEFDKKYFIQD